VSRGLLLAAAGAAVLSGMAAAAVTAAPENPADSTPAATRATGLAVPEREKSELEEPSLFADEADAPTAPAPRASDGYPDLSGFWKGSRATRPVGNIGKDLPGFKLPLTPAGEAALHHNLTETIDPESLCIIGGIPRHSASALPFEIVQNSRHVVFLYMYTYFRSIPFDVKKHPEDPDPTFFGDHIGWWEGDTFVIDTVAIKDGPIWIDENANPQSDAMHAVERWTRPDAGHLHLELTIHDPKFYTHPFTYQRTWIAGTTAERLREYSCSENNIDRTHLGPGPGPIRADGTRGYDVAPLPAVPPPPPESYDAK
jgi:hypothetical protein